MLDSKSIDSKLNLIKQSIQSIQNDTIDDKEFDTLMLSHFTSSSWISILIICVLSLAGVVAVVTILVCTRNFLAARGWTRMVVQVAFKPYFIDKQTMTLNLTIKSPELLKRAKSGIIPLSHKT
jgi:hypothetical protein